MAFPPTVETVGFRTTICMKFIVRTNKKEYSTFNGYECTVVNNKRDDDLIEVFVRAFNTFILLTQEELEDE